MRELSESGHALFTEPYHTGQRSMNELELSE